MSSYSPTVRDFSKSQEGREYLESLFNFQTLAKPDLAVCRNNKDVNTATLGRSFELVLRMVIERQNPNFAFVSPIRKEFTNFRAKRVREYDSYMRSGKLTDDFLDYLVSIANKRQQSFLLFSSQSKSVSTDALKSELQRIHELAAGRDWTIKRSMFEGMFVGGSMAAEVDLIHDETLIEIKTTEDARRHNEHLSQVFSYYLLSQAPIKKSGVLYIKELGIYYVRHGALWKQPISKLIRFPIQNIKRVTFDFMLQFSNWALKKSAISIGQKNESRLERHALVQVLQQLSPQDAWVHQTLEEHYKEVRNPLNADAALRYISVPNNFLLNNG